MRKHLLSLYPEAWRERYGDEMAALLDDLPPGHAATLDLLRGALVAHLRPIAPAPTARLRGTITGVLGCFIVFCVLGSGFAKTTENFDGIEHVHPLLGVSHMTIVIGSFVAAGALAVAAAPLALLALATALRTRDRTLMKLIAVPPTAIAVFAGSVGLLALWLNSHHHRAGLGGALLMGLCALCGGAGAFACWAAPRAILRRIEPPRLPLAFAAVALGLGSVCMVVVTCALGAFLIGIVADAPSAGAFGNGPGQLIDVTTSIAVVFAGALAASAVGVLSATRGLQAVRGLWGTQLPRPLR